MVVDNASSDDSAGMVRSAFPDVVLIEPGINLGFARANNVALNQAKGRAVLLLNPDTVCPQGSLFRLLETADSNPGYGAYGPMLVARDREPTTSYGNFPSLRHHWLRPLACLPLGRRWRLWSRFTHVPRRGDPDRIVHYIMGACLLIPRAALERVGLLDERFFLYFEETDWCLRARRAGLPARLCNAVEIVHLEGRAAQIVSRFSLVQFQHSYRQFMTKHAGRGAVRLLRLALFWEKGLQAFRHSLFFWSRRHRALTRRYAFEARLQLQSDLGQAPPAV
jgi:N-acetylglucosaminyl-diphospho-decaprenol L-rhamnosyltransferase